MTVRSLDENIPILFIDGTETILPPSSGGIAQELTITW